MVRFVYDQKVPPKKRRDFLTPQSWMFFLETKRGTTNSSETQVRDLCFLKYFGGLHVFRYMIDVCMIETIGPDHPFG